MDAFVAGGSIGSFRDWPNVEGRGAKTDLHFKGQFTKPAAANKRDPEGGSASVGVARTKSDRSSEFLMLKFFQKRLTLNEKI